MKRFLCGLAALGLLVGVAGHVSGQPLMSTAFTYTNIVPYPPYSNINPGPIASFNTTIILDFGLAAGSVKGADGNFHGYSVPVDRDGNISGPYAQFDVPVAGATWTQLLGGNNLGHFVGVFGDAAGNSNGYFYDGNTAILIKVPGDGVLLTLPTSVNDSDVIAGGYLDASFNIYAFILDVAIGKLTLFSVPGSDYTLFNGINNSNLVTGVTKDAFGNSSGFTFDGSIFNTVTSTNPSLTITSCNGLNDHNDIAASCVDAAGASCACVVDGSNGNVIRLDPGPGAFSSDARAINNWDQVAGNFSPDGIISFGFVATPKAP
jgi:hypothetical protein